MLISNKEGSLLSFRSHAKHEVGAHGSFLVFEIEILLDLTSAFREVFANAKIWENSVPN